MERVDARLKKISDFIDKLPRWVKSQHSTEGILEKLKDIEYNMSKLGTPVLSIGLLGGTGVGKSTIINGLAGTPISSTSHRRPHTERIIIYSHEEITPPFDGEKMDFLFSHYTHKVEGAKYLILCDLPDFDSIKKEHRKQVISFMDVLDLLVWVVSPEKYADQVLYLFLKEVASAKAEDNFYFLINKVDLLTDSPREIQEIFETFRAYLIAHNIKNPVILTISALEIVENKKFTSWNQWELFKKEIFRERNIKEIQQIKALNIFQELKEIEEEIDKIEKSCRYMADIVRRLKEEVVSAMPWWENVGRAIFGNLKSEAFKHALLQRAMNPEDLRGFSAFIGQLYLKKTGSASGPFEAIDGLRADKVKRSFEILEDRLSKTILKGLLSPSLVQSVSALYDKEELKKRLVDQWDIIFRQKERVIMKRPSRLFGFIQVLSFQVLTVLFILYLVDFWSVLESNNFSISWVGGRFVVLARKLFSFDGMAAIASFFTLTILTRVYFVGFYIKSLRHRAQKFIEEIESEGLKVWMSVLSGLLEILEKKEKELVDCSYR